MKGKFYFVGTPIGNLKDFSFRAVETLKNVAVILCEDTRNSLTLLNEYSIKNKLQSYHKFNYKKEIPLIIKNLLDGKNYALISDAGMPAICDPGNEIIEELVKNEIEYTTIPSGTAFVSAFVMSGFSAPFTFVGLLPEKISEKTDLLKEISNYQSTLIFYSSVHNINEDLSLMNEILGNRKIMIARELTKKFESTYFMNLADTYEGELKGEFVFVVDKCDNKNDLLKLSVEQHYNYYLNLKFSKNDAIKLVAKDRNVAKNEIYQIIVNLK